MKNVREKEWSGKSNEVDYNQNKTLERVYHRDPWEVLSLNLLLECLGADSLALFPSPS
jgi:hypothetical protein